MKIWIDSIFYDITMSVEDKQSMLVDIYHSFMDNYNYHDRYDLEMRDYIEELLERL